MDQPRGVSRPGLATSLDRRLAELKAVPKDHLLLFTTLPDPRTPAEVSGIIRDLREKVFVQDLLAAGIPAARLKPVRVPYPAQLPVFGSKERPGEGNLVCGIYIHTAIPRNAHTGQFAEEVMQSLSGFPQARRLY